VIVFRCLNGIVPWETSVISERPIRRRSFCMVDKFVVNIPAGPPPAKVTALEQMAAHSVTLKGAIQQVFELTWAPDF